MVHKNMNGNGGKGYFSALIQHNVISFIYLILFFTAVQKGRSPKSPLEGSVVDQLVGAHNANMQITVATNQHGAQNAHVHTYTNLMMRSDVPRYDVIDFGIALYSCHYIILVIMLRCYNDVISLIRR